MVAPSPAHSVWGLPGLSKLPQDPELGVGHMPSLAPLFTFPHRPSLSGFGDPHGEPPGLGKAVCAHLSPSVLVF